MARHRGQRKGHLYERSGWWMLRYRVDTPELDPATARAKRIRITVPIAYSRGPEAVGKREAQRIAWEEYLSKLDQASIRPSSMRTLREFVEERFQPDVMATLKPTGRAFYKNILGNHVLPALGKTRLREISVAHIQNLVNAKLQAGLSVKTAAHVRQAVCAVLRHARAMQWYAGELPTSAVRLPEMRQAERRALSWEQVCALAKALPEPVATLSVFLVLTGLRIGEAMGLRWKRVNLTSEPRIVDAEVIPPMSIAVRENFVRGRYQTLKTSASSRNVPIQEWFGPWLWKLLARGPWIGPDDAVFASARGTPLDQHNVARRTLKPVARELKMPWVSWHVFRHTNATLGDLAGLSVTERQRILGHAAEAMTLHYTHSDLDRLRERLEGMVDKTKLLQ